MALYPHPALDQQETTMAHTGWFTTVPGNPSPESISLRLKMPQGCLRGSGRLNFHGPFHPDVISFSSKAFFYANSMSFDSNASSDGRSKTPITQLMSGGDLLLEVMKRADSLPMLSKYALVHRNWTPLAYSCMYRDVHLTSGECISLFLDCMTAPSPHTQLPHRHKRFLVQTLRITLADQSLASREEIFHRQAFWDLFQILPHLTNLLRIMFEVHVLSKFAEYTWMTRCAALLPKSVKVFMINVCFFPRLGYAFHIDDRDAYPARRSKRNLPRNDRPLGPAHFHHALRNLSADERFPDLHCTRLRKHVSPAPKTGHGSPISTPASSPARRSPS